MDSLTQILLGAAVGEVVLGRKIGNKAMLYGAIAGTIPDLDVLSRSFMNDLSANEVHRGITHSLFFCLAAAPLFAMWVRKHAASFLSVFTVLIALVFFQGTETPLAIGLLFAATALLAVLIFRKLRLDEGITQKQWTALFWWTLVTHPLLDCHTTWGTQFFWPFPIKIAFNNIFVADPGYTVPLLVCLILAMFFKRSDPRRWRINRWGLYISTAYMVLTLFMKYKAHNAVEDSLVRQDIDYESISTRPAPLNTILWSVNVDAGDRYYLAYHSLLDSKPEVEFATVMKNHELLGEWATHEKVARLKTLSQDQFVISEEDGLLIFNDLRFGQLGAPGADKPFLFRYLLTPNGKDLHVAQYQRPELEDAKFSTLLPELLERVKGE